MSYGSRFPGLVRCVLNGVTFNAGLTAKERSGFLYSRHPILIDMKHQTLWHSIYRFPKTFFSPEFYRLNRGGMCVQQILDELIVFYEFSKTYFYRSSIGTVIISFLISPL